MPKRWKTVAVITLQDRDRQVDRKERTEEYDTEEGSTPGVQPDEGRGPGHVVDPVR